MTLFHFLVKKIEPLSDPAEMSGWGGGGEEGGVPNLP